MKSIRHKYQELGVEEFYKTQGNDYVNPHKDKLTKTVKIISNLWELDLNNSLDLCCGSGEITSVLDCSEGNDPYTYESYIKNTGKPCMTHTFDDIMHGKLTKQYNMIICSYALHLAEPSKLPQIIYQLSRICNQFLLISPHKKPEIKKDWGMTLDNSAYMEGIRIKLYKTNDKFRNNIK